MSPPSVVEVDVVADVFDRVLSGPVLPSFDSLALQAAEEALDDGVVVAVALPAHARYGLGFLEPLSVLVRRVLTSAVRVVQESRSRRTHAKRPLKSGQHELAVD